MGTGSSLSRIHIACWILKDAFWCMQFEWAAALMIIPTVLLNLFIISSDPPNRDENTVLLAWIVMNAVWMMHELWAWPQWTVWVALTLAITSLGSLVKGLRL